MDTRNVVMFWSLLTVFAVIFHYLATHSVAVPIVYGVAALVLVVVLDLRARRRLARIAGIKGPHAKLKTAMIEFAVDGVPLPPRAEREFLRAKLTGSILFLSTFAVVVVLLMTG